MGDIYQINNLAFAYSGRQVLQIEELRIAEHKVTAIAGPNGSGKSTLFDILAFLRHPTSGNILFNGQEATPANSADLRRRIGYVQQKPYLMKMSVRDNIALGLKFRRTAATKTKQAVEKIAEELRLQSLLDRTAIKLSGGEVQKIALARALVLEPSTIIMDEPFTYLDEQTETEIQDWIIKQKSTKQRTILFSTHDRMKAQMLGDQTLSLINGHVYTAPFSNMFTGRVDNTDNTFISGKARFELPRHIDSGHTLFIDPKHLVISKEKLPSSMRNNFQGVIAAMNSINGEVHLKIQGDAVFNVVITPKSSAEMALQPGQQVWVSCKSSQLRVI